MLMTSEPRGARHKTRQLRRRWLLRRLLSSTQGHCVQKGQVRTPRHQPSPPWRAPGKLSLLYMRWIIAQGWSLLDKGESRAAYPQQVPMLTGPLCAESHGMVPVAAQKPCLPSLPWPLQLTLLQRFTGCQSTIEAPALYWLRCESEGPGRLRAEAPR